VIDKYYDKKVTNKVSWRFL